MALARFPALWASEMAAYSHLRRNTAATDHEDSE